MAVGVFDSPLTPPHRQGAWAGAVDTDKEVEAMLPKEVLKYAEKAKDVDAAVLEVLKKREQAPRQTAQLGPFVGGLGQTLPRDVWESMQAEAHAQQLEMEAQREQVQQMNRQQMHRQLGRLFNGGTL